MKSFEDLKEILLRRVTISKTMEYNGIPCQEWTGAVIGGGYGGLEYEGKLHPTSRLAAHVFLGLDLNDPKQLACHHCDNPICIESLHLFIGTVSENKKDSVRKGRSIPFGSERQGKQEFCQYGHNDWVMDGKINRRCRTCRNARLKRYRKSKFLTSQNNIGI